MDELQYMNMFEKMTKAQVKDCMVMDDELVLVVKEGDMGLAIGRNGDTIKNVMERLGKNISVVEYSEKVEKFVRNIFAPVVLDDVNVQDGVVKIKSKESRRCIGKNGKKINRAKELMQRHFGIKEITVN